PAVDIEAVIDTMMAIGGPQGLLMQHHTEIASLDINPLIATPTGCTAVDARVLLQPVGGAQPATDLPTPSPSLARLLHPRSIAVVGVSSDGRGSGNAFIRHLRNFGFEGQLFIVHPSATEIDGVACYRSLCELPQDVDYAYVAVPAERVPAVLAAAQGRVAFAQVMSSGFAEVSGGEALQAELIASARQGSVRIIGPNCLGLHSTRARVSFIDKVVDTAGPFAVISQSGGMGVDILRRGQARGVRFSHLITIGNSADVSAVEILREMLADDNVGVIGMYLESVSDGRALLEVLQSQPAWGGKPVLLLKGGTSLQGQRAAASHTGALASNERLWAALAQQTGVAMVNTLDEFIDCALTFQLLEPNYVQPTRNVCLFGNGGGTSVVACDTFARHALGISPFSPGTVAQLDALQLPPGASVLNPIDTPVGVLKKDEGAIAEEILRIVYRAAEADAVVLHLNLPVILGYHDESLLSNLFQAALRAREASERRVHFVLVLRSDGSESIDNLRRIYRDDAISRGIVVYDELPQAAQALSTLAWVEHHGQRRRATQPR
nr:CoA-binding protein [Pseudomonas sp.]